MALSPEQKQELARQLAEKRRTLGDSGFEAYVNKLDGAIPQVRQQNLQQITDSMTETPQTKGVLGAISRFSGVDALGRGIAAIFNRPRDAKLQEQGNQQSIQVQQALLEQIKKNREQGLDTSRLEQALNNEVDTTQAFNQGWAGRADLGVSNRDVVGSAIRTAGTIASAGTYSGLTAGSGRVASTAAPQLTSATTIGRGALQGLGRGALTGARSGAVFGGVSGVASGIEQEKGVLGTAFEAVKQGAVGGVLGGAVGGLAGGIGGAVQARANRADELKQLLSSADDVDTALTTTVARPTAEAGADVATPALRDRATAGFTTAGDKVVKDKKAQALLKQGIQDIDVAMMQSMSPADRAAARKMVPIAKETARTGIPTRRQQEVVGETFFTRARDVEKLNRTAGQQIDDIARNKLAGKQVDAGRATDTFFNQLERDGVDIDALRLAKTREEIASAFEGSAYEGLDTVQRTLKTVLKRVDPDLAGANMDGLALHRAKRFIDNQVTYGKNAEGLVGDAERLLKSLRANIDDVLDETFPDYNTANTQYRDTIQALDEVRRLIGRDYLGSQDIANLRGGEVMGRILGNATARPMSALQNLENTARKYGIEYTDSIVKQVRFADLLDDIYETVPKGSLQGRVAGGTAEGVRQATGFANRVREGGLISATIDAAGDLANTAFGITPEARQKALEEFLNLSTK